jgi:hypothetical protein
MGAETSTPTEEQKVVQLPIKRAVAPRVTSEDPWFAVKQSLLSEQPEVYSSWLSDLAFDWIGTGQVRVTAPSRFVASYVSAHYTTLLERAIRVSFPELRQVSVGTA